MSVLTTGFDRDGSINIERRSQDVEPIIQQVARLRQSGESQSGEMWHVARIPKVMIEAYLQKHGINLHEFEVNPEHLGRMLKDPDMARFRIRDGRF